MRFRLSELAARSCAGCWFSVLTVVLCLGACGPETEGPPAAVAPDSAPQSRPNVIWILLDACRASNLSCYGYDRPTSPAIDAIAARGVLFERAYAQAFVTVHSVPSYLSGQYFPTASMGLEGWKQLFREPPSDEKLLPEILSANGYDTILVSAHPYITPESRLARAFDEATHIGGSPYASLFELVEAANDSLAETGDRPFFLHIHALDTHFPHVLEPPYDQWTTEYEPSARIQKGNAVQHRGENFTPDDEIYLNALHDGSIRMSDDAIAALTARVESLGLGDNTIWVIGADHGELLAEDGLTVGHGWEFEEVMRVPLILSGPGVPEGVRVHSLVENVDIVPTLTKLLSLETEARFDGTTLEEVWQQPLRNDLRERAFAYKGDGTAVVRTNDFTYHYNLRSGRERLWRGARTGSNIAEISPQDDSAARLRQFVVNDFVPLLEMRDKLPTLAPYRPFIESIRLNNIVNAAQMMTQRGQPADDTYPHEAKWTLYPQGLRNNGWAENAPPIELRIPIPNGTYQIQVEMGTSLLEGRPTGAILLKGNGELDFQRIEDASKSQFQFVELGTYSIDNGSFDIAIDKADVGRWALLRRFRFVPEGTGMGEGALEGVQDREEALRALGYL